MKIRFSFLLLLACVASGSLRVLAQAPQNSTGDPALTTEVAGLRQSVQTLNNRLKTLSDELFAPEQKKEDQSLDTVKKVTISLDLLTHAEERAEVLRRQLIEMVDKETALRSRMTQFDEDLRPENIDRSMAGVGGTRTAEMRDTRRRVLENDKRGADNLLSITVQGRMKLEEDVRQADLLVSKLRMRLFPLIDKEIDKINPPE
ncbi:MAG TPA: hypothetical protein VE961_26295 [Pyrinomonadaceae bacterium]|nr:hypothetical protein [Pyrinomonadaceae bacterium]